MNRRSLWQVMGDVLTALLSKMISFKNIIAIFASILGVYVASKLGATFMDWAKYQGFILILFYTSNQFQKWIFSKWPPLRGMEQENPEG